MVLLFFFYWFVLSVINVTAIQNNNPFELFVHQFGGYNVEVFKRSSLFEKPENTPWLSSVIHYTFKNDPPVYYMEMIRSQMDTIESKSCIRFVRVENGSQFLIDYSTTELEYPRSSYTESPNGGQFYMKLDDKISASPIETRAYLLETLGLTLGFGFDFLSFEGVMREWGQAIDSLKHVPVLTRARMGIPYYSRVADGGDYESYVATIERRAPDGQMSKIVEAILNRFYGCDPEEFYMGDEIPGAIKWRDYRRRFH